MEVDVHTAKTDLSKLIRQAEAGEEVFVTRRGQRVAKISSVESKLPKFGTLVGALPPITDEFLFAMNDDQADEFLGLKK